MNDTRRQFIEYHHAAQTDQLEEIRREVAELRPIGLAAEFSVAMGARPTRGVLCTIPTGGTYIFAKSRQPSDEQLDRWQQLWVKAEEHAKNAALAGCWFPIDPGCTIGNATYMVTGCQLRDFDCTHFFGEPGLSLLDDDELEFLTRLIRFWNAHPEAGSGVVNADGTITPIS